MYVDKEKIQDNLELHEESSEFLPLKKYILGFPRKQFLIGYIPDESRDVEEFYICVTEQATDTVKDIIEKMKQEQEERLFNTINKSVKEWFTQGTETEVDEAIVKNNRPLIEVEVETEYPIFSPNTQFKTVKAEQRRDGYMELRCVDEVMENVYRKRIDASVQVAPQYLTTEAQTTCTYPSNAATQYHYDVNDDEQLFQKCKQNIISYANENIEDLSELLRVNGAIDLYTDDYSALITNDTKFSKISSDEEVQEYMSFMDVNLCKGKMIADAVWHPMWTGIIAIAYANAAPNVYQSGPKMEDNVLKAVHGLNSVLIWSCLDGLRPKLILETPREVHKLSFCKFDENILIGGCSNGQIIIWDIRNKLQKVDEFEILTTAQQRYRAYMHSLMGWMKNIHDLSIVRPTAISDLRYSHKRPVTGINWLSPYYEFSKIGNLMEIPEDWDNHSMQFLSSSEDGTILIWDLLKKPTVQAGGFKPRKLKRLKKRPSALMVDLSPYHILHLNLKPIYKVNVSRKDKKFLAISNSHVNYCSMKYTEVNPEKSKKNGLHERIIYTPIFDRSSQKALSPEMHIGSMEGDYIHLRWDGQDFDLGEVVNSENAKVLSWGKYHDGPVNTVQISEDSDVILTVGGKVFALWRNDFPNRPILWRTCRQMYTTGEWNIFQPYMIINKIINGVIESWTMFSSSKSPVFSSTFSSQFLTASAIHPLEIKKAIYGAGDKQGAFRIFFMPENLVPQDASEKNEQFKEFIRREVKRKELFLKWQTDWNTQNASLIRLRENQQKEIMNKEEEERKAKEAAELEEKSDEKAVKKGPQPGKYVEWVKEQRQIEEEARIKSTIISKKQLDTKELEKRRKPLQKLDEENERKKRKQKQRLKEGESIFQDTVASLFPDVVKEKPAPPPDPYAGGESHKELEKCYYEYIELSQLAEEFIDDNPYHYDFDWKQVLISGKQRRRILADPHKWRKKKDNIQRSSAEPSEGTVTVL
ncbi:missing minor mitochondria isoform X2 [Leptinotarsa decemlineata]